MKNLKENYKAILIVIAAAAAIILLCVFTIQNTGNKAIAKEEQVNTAKSDINVQEKRRVDLVYNLADCVKEYDAHEAETLKMIVDGRAGNVESIQTTIAAVAEAYPELKSVDNYKTFMNELSTTENLIASYRSNYNAAVKEYNRYVRKFPVKQFLQMLGYELQNYEYLEYDAAADAPQNLFNN